MTDTCVKLGVFAMACRFEILFEDGDPVRLRGAGEEAIAEIEALDRQLSRFRPESDVSWINAHAADGPVKVEPRLFCLLQRAREISEATDGAFDITVGPLMRAWGFWNGDGRVPEADELDRAGSVVGLDHVVLDEQSSTIRFDTAGVQIDLGAIGKGYAIDRAVECLKDAGVTRALIHGGTSTVYGMANWEVGIPIPNSQFPIPNSLRDSALSVSAVHGRAFKEEGQEYGHVIDPRTGEPVSHAKLAAVWGPSATDCDALSTALLVLGENWLPELSARFAGFEGQVAGGHS